MRLEEGRELTGLGDVPAGDVGGLARVADHVVELGAPVAEVLHELELSVPDRRVRWTSKMINATI